MSAPGPNTTRWSTPHGWPTESSTFATSCTSPNDRPGHALTPAFRRPVVIENCLLIRIEEEDNDHFRPDRRPAKESGGSEEFLRAKPEGNQRAGQGASQPRQGRYRCPAKCREGEGRAGHRPHAKPVEVDESRCRRESAGHARPRRPQTRRA